MVTGAIHRNRLYFYGGMIVYILALLRPQNAGSLVHFIWVEKRHHLWAFTNATALNNKFIFLTEINVVVNLSLFDGNLGYDRFAF